MKKRITTVVLSMVLVAAIAMAIPTKASAAVKNEVIYLGSSSYEMTLNGNVLSSTQTKASLYLEHKSGVVLNVLDGFVESHAYNSLGTRIGFSHSDYEKYNTSSFTVTTTFSCSGGVVTTQAKCEINGIPKETQQGT